MRFGLLQRYAVIPKVLCIGETVRRKRHGCPLCLFRRDHTAVAPRFTLPPGSLDVDRGLARGARMPGWGGLDFTSEPPAGRTTMQYGLFTMPSHPPACPLYDGHRWDLDPLRGADELGYSEAWIGEHHTAPWEPHPAPDLLIAQALMETKKIRLAPGGFLLPYHHPAELANRVAMLDHMAQGRLNFGVAASGLPSDWAMFNVDGNTGQHREMTREALDIILKIWTEEEFDHQGKYWQVTKTGRMLDTLIPHIAPFQKPYPPIGVAGVSKGSETLKLAGEHGFLPMSLNLNPSYVASHWESVEEGARRSGRSPRRADWRLVREIFVAETDEAAWRLSVGAQMGRMMREYFLPLLTDVGVIQYLKHDDSVADSDVTPEYCATHNWLIGSPATVVDKIERMYEEVGGFGSLLLFCFDYSENPGAWRDSMRLLAEEVMPKVAHLIPKN